MKNIILKLLKKYYDEIAQNWIGKIENNLGNKLSKSQIKTFVEASLNTLIDVIETTQYLSSDQYLIDSYLLFSKSNINLLEVSQVYSSGRFALLHNIDKSKDFDYDPLIVIGFLDEIIEHHVSGQMKIAPEHCIPSVLKIMGKPPAADLRQFRSLFNRLTERCNKKQFLTYYFLAAHPGCTQQDMQDLRSFTTRELRHTPEQVQVFTPTPSTFSTLMYYTGRDPFTGQRLFVERDTERKQKQKGVFNRPDKNRPGRKNP